MILRARLIAPVGRPIIDDGAVCIQGKRLAFVGRHRDCPSTPGPRIDLGEVLLLPGLINAHCHLDYTDMGGQIAPTRSFSDWVKCITALKAAWSYSDFAASWIRGARMLLERGVTRVADIEAVPELLPDVWTTTPLRVQSFLEMTGVRSRREPGHILRETLAHIERIADSAERCGLSPHAPYSTPADLLRLSAIATRERRLRMVTHIAESAEEFEMFTHARGRLYDWLKRNDRDMADCGIGSPVEHLKIHDALGPRLLGVHLNFLGPRDVAHLAETGTHAVHCPRSHAYFAHPPFQLEALQKAGVNVCLGTDSLATVRSPRKEPLALDMFAEFRQLARAHPKLAPGSILDLATRNAAVALGLEDRCGRLARGLDADLIAVNFTGPKTDAAEHVVHRADLVHASMIAGRWALEPGWNESSTPTTVAPSAPSTE